MHRLGFLIVLIFFSAATAFAASAPVPASQRDKFKSLQLNIENTKKEKVETEEKLRKAETELNETRNKLVEAGKSVQKSEKDLGIVEKQITKLEEEKETLKEKLKTNRKSIAEMVLALERIRRLPPEALIAKPGAPIKTAQSVMLLEKIIPALDQRAQDVKDDLDRLGEVSAKLDSQKREATQLVASMSSEQQKLEDLANKRQKLFKASTADLKAQEAALQRYASQAQTLQDLMTKIEEQGRERKKSKSQDPEFAKSKALLPQPGNMRLPVSGPIMIGYNQPDNFGAPSKGLTIECRPGGLVVAPMGGAVRFAGPFKNYGNMVIIEHKKGFHSLIAGLEKIDTVVGQSVSAGEPLGFAHKKSADGPPSVYYELRQNGEPVNPARTTADLG